jgi:hypothetical protein
MFSGRNSLRYRLPAGIALIVTVAVTVFGALAYSAARRAAENAAWVRVRSVADRFAQVTRGALESRLAQVRSVAEDPRVVAFLMSGANKEAATAALSRLGPDSGQTHAIGLRDRYGATVLSLDKPLLPLPPSAMRLEDSSQVTALFESGGIVEYEHVVPVKRAGRVIGQVAMRRTVRSSPTTLRTLTALMGSNAILLLGNSDGTLWTDLVRRVERPTFGDGNGTIEHGGQKWIATTTPIPGSSLSIAVELPHAMRCARGAVAVDLWALAASSFLSAPRRMAPEWKSPILVRLTAAAESITADNRRMSIPFLSAMMKWAASDMPSGSWRAVSRTRGRAWSSWSANERLSSRARSTS